MDKSEAVDRKVTARLDRASIFEEPSPPELWVVLHEVVLRQRVGVAQVMAEQLGHILNMVERCPVVAQVVPVNAGRIRS